MELISLQFKFFRMLLLDRVLQRTFGLEPKLFDEALVDEVLLVILVSVYRVILNLVIRCLIQI